LHLAEPRPQLFDLASSVSLVAHQASVIGAGLDELGLPLLERASERVSLGTDARKLLFVMVQ
jgi:hypothetical protein